MAPSRWPGTWTSSRSESAALPVLGLRAARQRAPRHEGLAVFAARDVDPVESRDAAREERELEAAIWRNAFGRHAKEGAGAYPRALVGRVEERVGDQQAAVLVDARGRSTGIEDCFAQE